MCLMFQCLCVKMPCRRGVFGKLVMETTLTMSVRERCLSILCLNDLGQVPRKKEILLQRYREINNLLREGVVEAPVEQPQFLRKVEKLFLVLHRYQRQLEGTIRCFEKTVDFYGLHGYASELALSHEDIQVQLKTYEYMCNKLRKLPPLICQLDDHHACVDPALLTRYQRAITMDHHTLSEIYGDVFACKADACITFAKLCPDRRFGDSRFNSVLIHPFIPGQKGSLLISPSLLLDSLFFRFAIFLSLLS